MYLKRLEIHGFKSFADKVNLDFRQGLSVVVGPNGSGKSNISDAIRWVIGEQSAKSLRGTKMEDIIFAGSTKRRSVGMAEVSLILDNASGIFPLEFDEIMVTRRVYRSGESEYLINKATCRLKDVHELFMDTGIGRDGFSIIGQGRVEEILSAKPEDRRGLIEEVAGITKYRNRKREAARKLEETEQNLVRLADIIGELSAQIEPLRDQADTAQQYYGFKQELDELELNLAVHDIDEISAKLAQQRGQITQLQDSLVAGETALGVGEAETADAKLALQGLEEQIYQSQSNCHNLGTQIQQLEAELKLCGERTGSLEEQQRRLGTEIKEAEQKLSALRTEFQAEENKLLILQSTRQELQTQLATEEAQLRDYNRELGSSEHQIENMKNEAFGLLSSIAKHNNQITALNQQIENRQYRQKALYNQAEAKKAELALAVDKADQVINEQGKVRQTANDLVNGLNQLKVEQAQTETKAQELQRDRVGVRDKLQAASSRLKVLKDMQREHEGYNRGVKEVLLAADKGKLAGICGVVAELFQVPSRLEAAMEVALGGSLQNLVTHTEQAAKGAIAFLKAQKFGRATFLPLDALRPSNRSFDAKVLRAPGVLGVAADLVNCENEFRPVVEYLLGRILVVENLEMATQVAKLGGYRLRIVTLEGELLSPGGSMTGGSLQQRSNSLLSRNREISQLEEDSSDLQTRLTELQEEETALASSLRELGETRVGLQNELKELELNLASLDSKRVHTGQEKQRLEQELAQITVELEQIDHELTSLIQRQSEISTEKDGLQVEYDRLSDGMAKAQAEIKDQGTLREQLQGTITQLKIKIAALEQEESGLQTALERYYRQKDEYQTVIAERKQQQTELVQRSNEIAEQVVTLHTNIGEMVQSEHQAQEALNLIREQRQEKLASLTTKEEEIKILRRQVQEYQENLHSSQVREARLDTEINGAFTRLQENLGLSLAEARLQCKVLDNRREAVSRMNKLKVQISALGTVNSGAVEEYARVQERFTFLSTQQQDLLQAKASLFNVIAEMDQIMVERFGKTFIQVQENFASVFVELFGGGGAELQLTQPDNLLETGIEIIVQPPGKKLQHLSLLSGGEKALTAIALLFAMLKVKPSPFCVLDEIEAALDEANVNRFAAYLQELSDANQFIVISHRKGTMEAADVLFGITMEETGVSKLYSVKLVETEDTNSLAG